MASNMDEITKDIAELENLLTVATRTKVKDLLGLELRKLQAQFDEEKRRNALLSSASGSAPSKKTYVVKLSNYAWDQTESSVKIYVTLDKVHEFPPENITCKFTDQSLDLYVRGTEGKDYQLIIKNLLEKIKPDDSNWKIKSNMVVITLPKLKTKKWSHVTGLEKKAEEAKKPKFDDEENKADPSAALINMMKTMYESGDDEMKRTIAKAWTESNDKKRSGVPDFM